MPWCPKCKNEYRDGIAVCIDCGCDLVQTLQENIQTPIMFGSKEEMTELLNFLSSNNISSCEIRLDEKENIYELFVNDVEAEKSIKYLKLYLEHIAKVNSKQTTKEVENKEDSCKSQVYNSYVSSKEKLEDKRSSGIALLIVGCLGVLFFLLCFCGLIPLDFSSNTVSLLFFVFVFFIIVGILSLFALKKYKVKVEQENTLIDSLNKWCALHLQAQMIDQEVLNGEEDEAIIYFKRVQYIKEKLQTEFLNLDEAFVEKYVDDQYDQFFCVSDFQQE